jgi:hypothetical protein
MKYTVDIGSGGMIYMSSLIKIGSATQKLIGETQREDEDHIRLSFFQNKESRLKKSNL